MADEQLSARELGIRSRAAVHARDRDAWLDLFADDAVVQDPVGPSAFDPEGKGHHGRQAIAAFYDTVIAPSEAIDFEITGSYLCGDEVADVGIIRTTLAGGAHQAVEVLADLIWRHGQGAAPGAAALQDDHIFLIADGEEAFVLEACGRIEGEVRIGGKLAADQKLNYSPELRSYRGDAFGMRTYRYDFATDSQGRFAIDRVIPGRGHISRVWFTPLGNGALQSASSGQEPVEVKPLRSNPSVLP